MNDSTSIRRHTSVSRTTFAIALASAMIAPGCSHGAATTSPTSPAMASHAPEKNPKKPTEDRAARLDVKTRSLILAASRGSFVDATRDFGAAMKGALTPEAFASTWAKLEGQVGSFESIERVVPADSGDSWSDAATCGFARAKLILRVSYDDRDEIVGFHVLPATADVAWTAPAYAKPESFEERAVTVGAAHPLPGVLTLPRADALRAVVILVHGSGPNDADETVGALRNALLRDGGPQAVLRSASRPPLVLSPARVAAWRVKPSSATQCARTSGVGS